jgi:predicted ribosomally synthesized peptide with nif11-like leader
MSAEGATAFYERVSSDEGFRAKLEAANTRDDKHRIVTEAGYDVSRDDLSTIRKLAGASELSDEDLEKVAGGASATDVVAVVGGVLIADVPVVAAALAL